MNSICVFGVFVADLCFFGETIPVKGQTVLGKNHIVGPGGKGSNQAIAAARLKGDVHFITKIGQDSHADMALKLYKKAQININSIILGKHLLCQLAFQLHQMGARHFQPCLPCRGHPGHIGGADPEHIGPEGTASR